MLSERIIKIESSGIRKIFDIAMSGARHDSINLSIGQPDFDASEEMKEGLIKSLSEKSNRYTETSGLIALRKKIVEKLLKENDVVCSPEEVVVTAGVAGAIDLVLRVILNPGDEVILGDPYFVLYKEMISFEHGIPVLVDTDPDFVLTAERVAQKISPKTKAIILVNPSNPTGCLMGKEEIEKLVDLAKKHKLWIISDEIYEKFSYTNEFFSPGSIYEKVITLNGFSKSHGVTGWRIGYASGPKEVIDQVTKLQQYTYVCAPSTSQYAVLKAFDVDISQKIHEYRRKRDIVYDGLKDNFEITKPEGAFYIFPKVKGSGEKFCEKAAEQGVLLIPGNFFSKNDDHFRLCYAASDNKLKKAVEILNKISL